MNDTKAIDTARRLTKRYTSVEITGTAGDRTVTATGEIGPFKRDRRLFGRTLGKPDGITEITPRD